MSNLQAAVRSSAALKLDPAELTARVNRLIGENTAPDRFITFFYGIFDAKARRFLYANAGHNAPLVLGPDGSVGRLTRGGGALGISRAECYEQGEVALQAGDRMVLFTDGITEAANGRGEEFGEENLVRLLNRKRSGTASEIEQSVMAEIAGFTGGKFQDDATLIILALG